jgi:hypothetical protein
MNKYIIIAVIVSALPACSSISKETYTEQRTLTYPKGGHPYIKDMYLRNDNQATTQGANPMVVQPPVNTSEDWKYANPDIKPSYRPTAEDVEEENRLILARYYNNWLKS